MATEALKKFADELKFARESKEISLQQIANKTRIDIKFLRAIEAANFDILPEIYIKAFIKEYANLIELDPKETVKKYEFAKTGKLEQTEQLKEIITTPEPEKPQAQHLPKFDSIEQTPQPLQGEETQQSKKLNNNYVYGGIIVLLVLILFYVLFIHGSTPEIISEPPVEESSSQNSSRFEIEKPKPDVSSTQQPVSSAKSDSLRILLQTNARVWVKVTADGKVLQQQVVQQDSKLNYAASKFFSVSVGNAGAVKLFFNNKPVTNIGNTGEIRNIYLTADTIRYMTIAPQPKNEKKPAAKN